MSVPGVPRPLRVLAGGMHVVAGVLLLVIAVLTVADVLSRTLRDTSILGTAEISAQLLVAVAFLGLASAELHGRHVTVGLLTDRLGPKGSAVAAGIRTVVLVLVGAVLLWGLVQVLISSVDRGETTNGILRLATWPAKTTLLLSFALFFVVAIGRSVAEWKVTR
ncbi:TRAP transporter small permease subunit [uncultured Serinicoccus sp.]|uniref:TRAP transporter small permease subunit n=1 Tax=uncultured Serinicoccus sp. TaxID=735514 RepID=UPI002615B250|nr:TRAP transporter small permease [uncultured Serinicoccus sp.]